MKSTRFQIYFAVREHGIPFKLIKQFLLPKVILDKEELFLYLNYAYSTPFNEIWHIFCLFYYYQICPAIHFQFKIKNENLKVIQVRGNSLDSIVFKKRL